LTRYRFWPTKGHLQADTWNILGSIYTDHVQKGILISKRWLSHGGTCIFHPIGILHPEHGKYTVPTNSKEYRTLGYFRYVDVLLIIYNEKAANIDNRLSEFNNVLPKLKFISELEENGNINFLDITITKSQDSIETAIYRKPTTTDCIMPHDSCHPTQHKISGIRYLVNRKLGYPVRNNKKTDKKKSFKLHYVTTITTVI